MVAMHLLTAFHLVVVDDRVVFFLRGTVTEGGKLVASRSGTPLPEFLAPLGDSSVTAGSKRHRLGPVRQVALSLYGGVNATLSAM